MFFKPARCNVCEEPFDLDCSMGKEIVYVCDKCRLKQRNKDQQLHLDKLDAMSLEERVRRIEIILYEQSLEQNKSSYIW